MDSIQPKRGDALILVDVQKDFLPGGNLAVPHGDQVIEPLNRAIEIFSSRNLPIFATRDWHPPNHCSFHVQGGPWPSHCVAGTSGASFPEDLRTTSQIQVISKATSAAQDAYSGFQGTELDQRLKELHVSRLYVGGLATDYCVLNTVKDAIQLGYEVCLLKDAIRAVNAQRNDEQKAKVEMENLGAVSIITETLMELKH